jgi:hypothetical protein
MLDRFRRALTTLHPRTLARTHAAIDKLLADGRETRRTIKQLGDGQRDLGTATERILARLETAAAENRALRQQIATLQQEAADARQQASRTALRESQVRAVIRADASMEHELATVPAVCDLATARASVQAVVAASTLHLHPFPYVVLQDVLPDALYDALVQGIPPIELFGDKPLNKQQLKIPFTLAPAYSRQVWHFFINSVVPRALKPALLDKFRQPLEEWIAANWPTLAHEPFAPPMEFMTGDGRIMLRGPGYRIRPHRDPKWGFLTCILYLARPGDDERWGTELYSVIGDREARGAAPHWVDASQCRVEAQVPFRRNSMLVFLNSTGAHGAHIPEEAQPADLRRYIYQCRIGPSPEAARTLMALLPENATTLWAGKVAGY